MFCILCFTETKQAFVIFLQSVFYIGKGTSSRPFAHFKEAVEYRQKYVINQCQVSHDDYSECYCCYTVVVYGVHVCRLTSMEGKLPNTQSSRNFCQQAFWVAV